MESVERPVSGVQRPRSDTLDAGRSTLDQAALGRLKWRARRGLLENDLVLERFFAKHCAAMTPQDVEGLTELLELTDNELMDLILARTELEPVPENVHALRVLNQLRRV
ncbi:MAG: succinate dehydrogenase assembly factor 2 [Burkholderiaceae bacterium]